ncbi:MAG: Ltp family lipoprotein, partial [Brevibacterium sp.]|nr:Ltp family lipoprotein [Brevibacterium sp.]
TSASQEQSDTASTSDDGVGEPAEEAAPVAEEPAEGEAPAEEPEPEAPAEHSSALNQADTYANTMHMSKAGVFDQLTSEYGGQFSEDAAQYAVDNVDADWNENALESAKTYQDDMSMSPDAIHDQLTSEYGGQFTQEEADYAIENLNS